MDYHLGCLADKDDGTIKLYQGTERSGLSHIEYKSCAAVVRLQ